MLLEFHQLQATNKMTSYHWWKHSTLLCH